MKRKPFDEVCACEHATAHTFCICQKRKEPAKAACPDCMAGTHKMKRKD